MLTFKDAVLAGLVGFTLFAIVIGLVVGVASVLGVK